MLDGETIIQGDVYYVSDKLNKKYLKICIAINVIWLLLMTVGVAYTHSHAEEMIKIAVAKEVPGQIRTILLP